jgi:hypothetical protein
MTLGPSRSSPAGSRKTPPMKLITIRFKQTEWAIRVRRDRFDPSNPAWAGWHITTKAVWKRSQK